MPINAYFRQTCKDPHYDSSNTGTPITHMTLSLECRAEAPTWIPAPEPDTRANKAQQEVLKTMHQIALEYFEKPMHSTNCRLSSMLHNYIQQTGLGKMPYTSLSKRSLTPRPPTMADRSKWTTNHWSTHQKPLFTAKRMPPQRSITGPSSNTSQGEWRCDSPHRHRQEKHSLHWRRDNH